MFADKHVAQSRYAICRSCEQFQPLVKMCAVCGCFMPAKVRIASRNCPESKWLAVSEVEDDDYEVEE